MTKFWGPVFSLFLLTTQFANCSQLKPDNYFGNAPVKYCWVLLPEMYEESKQIKTPPELYPFNCRSFAGTSEQFNRISPSVRAKMLDMQNDIVTSEAMAYMINQGIELLWNAGAKGQSWYEAVKKANYAGNNKAQANDILLTAVIIHRSFPCISQEDFLSIRNKSLPEVIELIKGLDEQTHANHLISPFIKGFKKSKKYPELIASLTPIALKQVQAIKDDLIRKIYSRADIFRTAGTKMVVTKKEHL